MNQEILNLEEYRCRQCSRLFYINAVQRTSLDIDFGCPYGCDDNGERARDIVAQIKEEADGRVNDFQTIKDYKVTLSFLPGEFELSMGRSPRDQNEFDVWARLAEKGLLNGHVDWDILYECACDAMLDCGDEK
ncbi:hypothetical protein ACFL5Z_17020 [Planctomycetota bacterium]